MSRRIKFRYWDGIEIRPITGYFWEEEGFDSENLADVDEYRLMQYTGLKDKNGVEIYEGDILRWQGDNIMGRTKYTAMGQVLFEMGSFIARTPEQDDGEGAYLWTLLDEDMRNRHCEIIGNIYENPELLEAGDGR